MPCSKCQNEPSTRLILHPNRGSIGFDCLSHFETNMVAAVCCMPSLSQRVVEYRREAFLCKCSGEYTEKLGAWVLRRSHSHSAGKAPHSPKYLNEGSAATVWGTGAQYSISHRQPKNKTKRPVPHLLPLGYLGLEVRNPKGNARPCSATSKTW